jgi:hypothetical protein
VPWLRPIAGTSLVVHAALGNHRPFLLPAAASGMREARSGSRAHPLEPRQAAGDDRDDGISRPLGAAAVLARDGSDFSDGGWLIGCWREFVRLA